jgi:site-specific recombinase XerD
MEDYEYEKPKSITSVPSTLPSGLEQLLTAYCRHCAKNGLREGSIAQYGKVCGWFLRNLAVCDCAESSDITASRVVTACLELTSNSYLEAVRTFLRYCAASGKTDRDYSYVIPPYRRPQPMPSVYSEDEIKRMEAAIDRTTPVGKRDYALVLLGTRLGLRLDESER